MNTNEKGTWRNSWLPFKVELKRKFVSIGLALTNMVPIIEGGRIILKVSCGRTENASSLREVQTPALISTKNPLK